MKKIYLIMAFGFVALTGCDKDEALERADYVGFESTNYSFNLAENATTTKDIKVYSTKITGSDRTYDIVVDEDATNLTVGYTVASSVTIPANTNVGSFPISITDDESLKYVAQSLVVDFQDEAGLNSSESIAFNVVEECLETLVKLTIATDTWPEETSYELYDLSGTPTVIASGGPFAGSANTSLTFSFCLSSGLYGIAVYDSYGDGGSTYSVTSDTATYVAATTLSSTVSSAQFTID